MADFVSKGKCTLCGATFKKAAMTRHLKACAQKAPATGKESSGKRSTRKVPVFHLVVEGREYPEYWMHLEVDADATLEEIDYFLRKTWLECCHHMSAFVIEGNQYSIAPHPGEDESGMDVMLKDVLAPGIAFSHEYDFGTTTHLVLRAVAQRTGKKSKESIRVLARNEPPPIMCGKCGKEATDVCTECIWSTEEAWLCEKCAPKHECGEDMLLPVVNSPRVGVCGYMGPEDEG
jgi:hypothetical protein